MVILITIYILIHRVIVIHSHSYCYIGVSDGDIIGICYGILMDYHILFNIAMVYMVHL